MRTASLVVASVLVLTAGNAGARVQAPPSDEWRAFSGAWSALGRRQTLPTEGARGAATIQLSGSVVLASSAGLSRAFRAEAIGYDDGNRLVGGRAMWTDTRGDRVFSELRGETLAAGRRIAGTITGGTGRYVGIAGDWELTWQFVVETEEGEIQGRAADFRGRFRGIEKRQ